MQRLVRLCPGRKLTTSRTMSTQVQCTATQEVLESGGIRLDATQSAPILEEASSSGSQVRTLWLNRPSALHALTYSMNARLYARLHHLDTASSISCIVLRSTGRLGRAFCAGGDIRAMYANATSGQHELIDAFFRREYELNARIAALDTPLIALLDGIVMGGGVGLGVHARFRVATEHTAFAMPECAIGLHPDIGASFFLPRLQGRAVGAYLALTGARVRARDAVALGVATHYVESHYLNDVVRRLECVDVSTPTAIDKVLREFESDGNTRYPGAEESEVIERCFAADCVEEIVGLLREEGGEFAEETLRLMEGACPVSLKVSLESVRRGEKMSLLQCLDSEFRLSMRLARNENLREGIRAAVIERRSKAVWKPAELEEVSREQVLAYFAPVEEEFGVAELGLESRANEEGVEAVKMQSRM